MPFLLGWAISLCLPALSLGIGEIQEMYGWAVLTSGYYAMAAYQFGWLANIALSAVLVGLSSWGMRSRWLVVWSILLLTTTLNAFDLFLRPDFWGFKGAGPGFWLWTISNCGAAVAGLVVAARQRKMPR